MKKIKYLNSPNKWWRIEHLNDGYYTIPFANDNIFGIIGAPVWGFGNNASSGNIIIYNQFNRNLDLNKNNINKNYLISQNISKCELPIGKFNFENGYIILSTNLADRLYMTDYVNNWRFNLFDFSRNFIYYLSRQEQKSFTEVYFSRDGNIVEDTNFNRPVNYFNFHLVFPFPLLTSDTFDESSLPGIFFVADVKEISKFYVNAIFAKYSFNKKSNNFSIKPFLSSSPLTFGAFPYIQKGYHGNYSSQISSTKSIDYIIINIIKSIKPNLTKQNYIGERQYIEGSLGGFVNGYSGKYYFINFTKEDHEYYSAENNYGRISDSGTLTQNENYSSGYWEIGIDFNFVYVNFPSVSEDGIRKQWCIVLRNFSQEYETYE